MDLITGLILGAVQGLTEFLPISSSGHLVLTEKILGGRASTGLIFEVLVHFATLVAVMIYFRTKIWRILASLIPPYTSEKLPYLKLAGIIIVGSIPAAIIGLAFKDQVEAAFNSTKLVSLMLIITALILLSTRIRKPGNKPVGFGIGLLIGIGQSIALLPGISRSGTTISTGLHLKTDPAEAAEFSFLLSLPAVFGAGVLKTFDLLEQPVAGGSAAGYIAGAIAALIVGYLSIVWLMKLIKKGQFFYFGIYCLLIGLVSLIWL